MQGNGYDEQARVRRQLEAVRGQFEELSIRVTLPEVVADRALFQRLMREHSELSDMAEVADQYLKLCGEADAAR